MSRLAASPSRPEHVPAEPLADDERPPSTDERDAASLLRSRARPVFTLLAVIFFLTPALLYIAGHRSKPLSGERILKAPSLGQGWAFFDDTTQYLTQQLPYRRNAITAYNWISRHIWGSSPRYGNGLVGADKALPFGGVNPTNANGGYAQTGGAAAGHPIFDIGRDDWFFLQGELDIACSPPVGFDTAVQRWNSFVNIIRASGRGVVLLIAPEKSTIYPEYVGPKTVSWRCAQRQKARLWSKIEAMRNPDLAPLRQPLLAAKRRDPSQLLYLPLDSHWNDLAALMLVETALKHVGGAVRVAPGDVRSGTKRYVGDLTRFTGTPRTGLAPAETIQRPGDDRVETVFKALAGTVTLHAGGPGTVLQGTTLFLHDSFGDAARPMLQHYAARLVDLPWLFTSPRQIVQVIRQSRVVIVETSERDFLNRAAIGIQQSVLTPAFLKSLPQLLGSATSGP
jgi:alginate O-acetyltransferase complex protein AlgJ